MDNRIAITINELVKFIEQRKTMNETERDLTNRTLNQFHMDCAGFVVARLKAENETTDIV